MKRILLIGSGGAGKSTLARELGKKLSIEVTHLDRILWRPNWEPIPKKEKNSRKNNSKRIMDH